jgi:hypothetical protein
LIVATTTPATPADLNVRLQADDGVSKLVDQVSYQSMVGSVLYAAIATGPDISQAVGVVSKYTSEPTEGHLTAVKRILRYLKGTADLAITYKRSEDTPLFGCRLGWGSGRSTLDHWKYVSNGRRTN